MKKFITAAALFAASTALASAADGEISALVHLGFNGAPSSGVNLTNDGTLSSATVAKNDDNYLNFDSDNFPSSETGYSFKGTGNGAYITIAGAISWDSAWTATFAVKALDTALWHNLFSIGNGWLRIQNTTASTDTSIATYGTASWTNGLSSFALSGDSFKVVTMTYDVADGTSTFNLYGDGARVSSLSIATSSLNSIGTTVCLGGNPGYNNYQSYYDEFAIYDAALTQEQIQANLVGKAAPLTISTIPEPSAFGLLAGAGALALVAARRRRSRKA